MATDELQTNNSDHSKSIENVSYHCEICNKKYRNQRCLTQHARVHMQSKNMPYKCTHCDKSYSMLHQLEAHIKKLGPSVTVLRKCHICKEAFEDGKSFNDHMATHNPTKVRGKHFKCHYCGYTCTCAAHLRAHLLVHTGDEVHTCQYCGMVYSRIKTLKRHLSIHEGRPPKHKRKNPDKVHQPKTVKKSKTLTKKNCESTNQSTSTEVILAEDFRSDEEEMSYSEYLSQIPVTPDFSRHSFVTADQLEEYEPSLGDTPLLSSQSGNESLAVPRLTSQLLQDTDSEPLDRTIHMTRTTCPQASSSTADLDTPKEDRYTCEVCGKKLDTSSHLKDHMVSHSADLKHACHLCDKKFKFKNSLVKHLKRHTGDLPYKCSKCSAAFSSECALRVHNTSHMCDKAKKCGGCGKSFPDRTQLFIHRETCEKVKPASSHNSPSVRMATRSVTSHQPEHTEPSTSIVNEDSLDVSMERDRSPAQMESDSTSHDIENGDETEDAESTPLNDFEESPPDNVPVSSLTDDTCSRQADSLPLTVLLNDMENVASQLLQNMTPEESLVTKRPQSQVSRRSHTSASDPQQYKCDECTAVFSKKKALRVHKSTHQTKRCCECGESFKSKKKLKQHRNTCTVNKDNSHAQSVTAQTSPGRTNSHSATSDQLEPSPPDANESNHADDIGDKDDEYIPLPEELEEYNLDDVISQVCSEVLTEQSTQVPATPLPLPTRDPLTGLYSCEVCGKKLGTSSHLRDHMVSHSADPKHKCHLCDKKFKFKNSLVSHLKRHSGDLPYKCSKCSAAFTKKSELGVHEAIHGARTCRGCESSFQDLKHLREHQYTCTKYKSATPRQTKKAFVCSYSNCTKSFTCQSRLDTHTLTHTGEKPHQCKTCSRRFAVRSTLNRHMITHTGEKLFSCAQCSHLFATGYHLRRHNLSCHKENGSQD